MLRSLWNPSVTLQKETCETPAEPEKQSSLAYIVCVRVFFVVLYIIEKEQEWLQEELVSIFSFNNWKVFKGR